MGAIRFLLAFLVIMYHCGQFECFKIMQGPQAVQSFYIISGFYMAMILHEKYVGHKHSYRLFITNRFLRLYPIYWAVLFATVLFSFLVALTTGGVNWGMSNAYKTYGANLGVLSWAMLILNHLLIIGQDWVMYLGVDIHTHTLFFTKNYTLINPQLNIFLLVGQAWSVSLEIIFYLIAPFFVRKPVWQIGLLLLVTLTIKCLLHKIGLNYDPWTYRFFPAELTFFLLGVLGYKLHLVCKNIFFPKWWNAFFFAATILVVIFYAYLHYYIQTYLYFIGLATAIPFVFQFSRFSKIDKYLGEFSYPIYIVHVFVKSLVYALGFTGNISIAVLLVSVAFAYLLNKYIGEKVEKIRQARLIKAV